jgi:hypothetical protein
VREVAADGSEPRFQILEDLCRLPAEVGGDLAVGRVAELAG